MDYPKIESVQQLFDLLTSEKQVEHKFLIENTSNEARKSVLFGYNTNLMRANFGSEEGIKVVPDLDEVSYAEILMSTSQYPILIQRVLFEATEQTIVNYNSKSATGSHVTAVSIVVDKLQIHHKDFEFPNHQIIGANEYWEMVLQPKQKIEVTVYGTQVKIA